MEFEWSALEVEGRLKRARALNAAAQESRPALRRRSRNVQSEGIRTCALQVSALQLL